MPRYAYKCNDCQEYFEVFHGMSEDHESCDLCTSNNIHRVPQMVYFKQERTSESGKVGDDVKRAIEENRDILKEEKKKRVELPDGN